jgi:cation:H+ antiporter
MVAVAVACVPVFITGGRISRGEGLLFLGYYAAYNGYLVLQILRHPSLALFDTVMLGVVIPLTTAVLIVMMVRELRSQR